MVRWEGLVPKRVPPSRVPECRAPTPKPETAASRTRRRREKRNGFLTNCGHTHIEQGVAVSGRQNWNTILRSKFAPSRSPCCGTKAINRLDSLRRPSLDLKRMRQRHQLLHHVPNFTSEHGRVTRHTSHFLTSGEKHRESTGSFTHEILLEEHICAMETFGTNGDDFSVWEHSLDDLSTETRSTRRRLRPCTPGKPSMVNARLSGLPLCATHHHQHPSECPSDATRTSQPDVQRTWWTCPSSQTRTASSVHRWHCVQHTVTGIQHNARRACGQRNTMTTAGRVTKTWRACCTARKRPAFCVTRQDARCRCWAHQADRCLRFVGISADVSVTLHNVW